LETRKKQEELEKCGDERQLGNVEVETFPLFGSNLGIMDMSLVYLVQRALVELET
jgi:hypothetical protein